MRVTAWSVKIILLSLLGAPALAHAQPPAPNEQVETMLEVSKAIEDVAKGLGEMPDVKADFMDLAAGLRNMAHAIGSLNRGDEGSLARAQRETRELVAFLEGGLDPMTHQLLDQISPSPVNVAREMLELLRKLEDSPLTLESTVYLHCETNSGICSDEEVISIPKHGRASWEVCRWNFKRKSRAGSGSGTGPFLIKHNEHSITVKLYAKDQPHNARGWHEGWATLVAIQRRATRQQKRANGCELSKSSAAGVCYVVKRTGDVPQALGCLQQADSTSELYICAEEMREIKVAECMFSQEACAAEIRAWTGEDYVGGLLQESEACE